MNRYETVFILTFVLSEDQAKEVVVKFKGVFKDVKAKIHYEENWGLCKLVYFINKKIIGFYYLIEFVNEGDVISKLEIEYKCDERIICFFIVKLDKYVVVYNEKKRGVVKKEKVNVD